MIRHVQLLQDGIVFAFWSYGEKKTVVKKKLFVCLYLQQKEKNDRNRILAKIKQLKKHF